MGFTYSGRQSLTWSAKASEATAQAAMIWRGRNQVPSLEWIDEYQSHANRYVGVPLESAKILELGYGARPIRLLTLLALGVDVVGIDRDKPALTERGQLSQLIAIARENGASRAAKTLGRRLLEGKRFDTRLRAAIAERGGAFREDSNRLLVGDITDPELPALLGKNQFQLVYSEDVFEHVPREGLERACSNIAAVLATEGVALIRPNVFTGITGGHLTEWYHSGVASTKRKKSEPWEHLRLKRFRANTYLNELTRQEYRTTFAKYFDILDEVVKVPNLGRHLLTPEIRQELSMFSEDELFSNQVLWVLRRRSLG